MSEKTYIYDGGSMGGSNVESMLLGSMMNGGGFGGMNGANGIWPLIYLVAMRSIFGNDYGNGGGRCQMSAIQDQLQSIQGQNALMNAITGGTSEIRSLANTLNCDVNAVQAGINAVQGAIAGVANQTGMSSMQVINSIQAGNTALANQISQCCCDNKLLATQQGYENRIATTEQTAILGGKIDGQTTFIKDQFCQLEMREMQNKLDSERAKTAALTNQLSQEHQNATFAAMLAPLQADINEIKCKQPTTATIPYSPVVGVPSCVAWQYGLNGLGVPFGNQTGGGFL